MANPILRFVDSPDVGATVRLDVHQAGCWTDPREWEWGAPPLLGDPDGRGNSYGLRSLRFTWYVEGTKGQALARLSELARELLRDGSNYLAFQVDPLSPPAWFELVRSEPGAMSVRWVRDGSSSDIWGVDVSLLAEPFMLGAREEFDVTVATNPATTDAMTAVLPTIKGDAPAPLVMDLPSLPGSGTTYRPEWAVVPVLDGWPGAQWFPINTSTSAVWTMSTDATLGASGATVTFASNASNATRVRGKVQPDFAGRYRALVLVTASGGPFTIYIGGDPVELSAGAQFIEAGMPALPMHNLPISRPYEVDPPSINTVLIGAGRTGASGSLLISGVLLIPVDLPADGAGSVTAGRVEGSISGVSVGRTRLDGDSERVFRFAVSGGLTVASNNSITGAFPSVVPGAQNVLHFLLHGDDGIGTAPLTITCSYAPRWLFLAAS